MLGSIGPGTKLPTLGHVPYATLRDAYQENAAGLIAGGVDALIVETCQDLLQCKAAVIGARRAMAELGREVPLICHVTVETTGTMLLGSEIGAALTALEPLGVDLIGLNCATGPAEMTEHLRYLSQHARVPLSVMPNAGLPELTADGAHYPLTPDQLADGAGRVRREYGTALVGGCCGTTPEHIRAVVRAAWHGARRRRAAREPRPEPGVSSHLPPRAVRAGRQRADGGGADQRQRFQGVPRGDARRRLAAPAWRSPAARPATARTCSTCAWTTSAATAWPTCGSWPAGSPPRPPCRSCWTRPSRR